MLGERARAMRLQGRSRREIMADLNVGEDLLARLLAKPCNRAKRITWMNSDPRLVRLFLEALFLLGIEPDRVGLRLQIHETADEQPFGSGGPSRRKYPSSASPGARSSTVGP